MKRICTLITLLTITLAAFAFGAKYSGRQPTKYYDMLGRTMVEEGHYVVYELMSKFADDGASDLFKYRDLFWDRWKGQIFGESLWFGASTTFRLNVGEKMNVLYTPLTFSKPTFDGIGMSWMLKDIRAGRWTLAKRLDVRTHLARISDDVIVEPDPNEWEELGKVENNYLFGASITYEEEPFNLYIAQPESGNTYIVERMIPLFEINKLQFNTVNMFHNNSLGDYLTLDGNVLQSDSSTVYVKISPYPVTNATSTNETTLYPIDGTNYLTAVATPTNGDVTTGIAEEYLVTTVDGTNKVLRAEGYIVLQVNISQTNGFHQQVKQLLLSLRLSGTFLVQANTENAFLSSSGSVPPDTALSRAVGSATPETYTFSFGKPASRALLSFAFDVTLLQYLTVGGELATSIERRQYPTTNRRYDVTNANASLFYATFAFPIPLLSDRPLTFFANYEFHHIDKSYSTTFYDGTNYYTAVDDNDDNDNLVGDIAGATRHDKYLETVELPTILDRNDNGLLDYEETIIRFNSENIFFFNGFDRNNNSVPDNVENDLLPDYPFSSDSEGHHFNAKVAYDKASINADVTFGMIRDLTLSSTNMDKTNTSSITYVGVNAHFTPLKNTKLTILYEMKVAKDYIENSYINENGISIEDALLYKNSVVNTVAMNVVADAAPFSFKLKGKYIRNDMRDASNALNHSGMIAQVDFNQPLVEDLLTLRMGYQISELNQWADSATTYLSESVEVGQSFMTVGTLLPDNVFSLDVIYSFYLYNNLVLPDENYNEHTLAFQLSGEFNDRVPVVLIFALKYDLRSYDIPNDLLGRENYSAYQILFRLMSQY